MKKTELIESLAEKCGMTRVNAAAAVNHIFAEMSEAIVNGEGVAINGFGSFKRAERKAKKLALNFNAQKKEVEVPATFTVKFKSGKTLATALDEKYKSGGKKRKGGRKAK